MSGPSASELLQKPGALLTRSHLRELGLERRAIDAVFRECPVIVVPGYSRPMIRAEAYLALLDASTYCDRCGSESGLEGQSPGAPQRAPGRRRRNGPARTRPETCKEVPIVMFNLPRPARG